MIKTSTWVRDSHELFDYESPHLIKKSFRIQNTCKSIDLINWHLGGLFRNENDIEALGEKEIFNLSFSGES